jgi:hypothetical protein
MANDLQLYDVVVTQKHVGVVSVWMPADALPTDILAEGQRYANALAHDGKLHLEYDPDDVVAEEYAEGDPSVRREDFAFNLGSTGQ